MERLPNTSGSRTHFNRQSMETKMRIRILMVGLILATFSLYSGRGQAQVITVIGARLAPFASDSVSLTLSGFETCYTYSGVFDLPVNDNDEPSRLIARSTSGWRLER